jgi:hypothetical protein
VGKPNRLLGGSLGQGSQLTQRFKHLPDLVRVLLLKVSSCIPGNSVFSSSFNVEGKRRR